MTYRSLHGLTFKVFSPSLWELCAYDDCQIALVTIAYIPKAWWIDVLMKAGHSHHRGPFATRNAAIAAIAGHKEMSA